MEKQKKWQLFLIILVIALTIYNILPTVFYYAKPLKSPIDESRAKGVALSIAKRVDNLEKDCVAWLHSYCDLLKIKPSSIIIDNDNPQQVTVSFQKEADAKKLRTYLPRAGSLIPFSPSQLSLSRQNIEENPKTVLIQRRIPIHFDPKGLDQYFTFSEKIHSGEITPLYQEIVFDRAAELGVAIGGFSEPAMLLTTITDNPTAPGSGELAYTLASNILSYANAFGENSPIAARYFASFTQGPIASPTTAVQSLSSAFDTLKDQLRLKRIQMQKDKEALKDSLMAEEEQNKIRLIERKEEVLSRASAILKKNSTVFARGITPWKYETLFAELQKQFNGSSQDIQEISVGAKNPFFSQFTIDWAGDKIQLRLHDDVVQYKNKLDAQTGRSFEKDQFDQLLINEIARVSRLSGEQISFQGTDLSIPLHALANSRSLLILKLSEIAKVQADQIVQVLKNSWNPKHPELSQENFPIWDYATYLTLSPQQQSLGLVVLAPSLLPEKPFFGLRNNSVYVIAKGVESILQKYQAHPDSEDARTFIQDFYHLQEVLQQNGYVGYSGAMLPQNSGFAGDYVFERDDYYQTILNASRENFHVSGSKKYAYLEFTDVEQRLLATNKIETRMHEDLLKARDDYNAAQVSLNPEMRYDVPKPIKNALWNNTVLSFKKYFRGDERKVLHWGLDLSGGKTVSIELRDQNNRPVTNEADIKQGINELYNRVNKMGVSEVGIRQEGSKIVLDFPGSQSLSAAELVKASSMYFHVVNEKFSSGNTALADTVNRFLQEVWNEAVVTNRKDAESINAIAWKHLYGDSLEANIVQPRSDAARMLYDNGLKLADPYDSNANAIFNDSLSKIAVIRGDDYTEWHGQTHPLMVVFRNFALEGSNLDNIRAAYDPSKGNYLSFEVRGSYSNKDGQKISTRDDLYAWTSQFAKDKVMGTPNETYSSGRGWRMAVLLNDSIISSPTLDSALRDSAMITGSFSQREVNQLAADLKAGSLTFTPRILSEKNVSPELGVKDRTRGIVATIVALILVIACMVGYYRFAGVVASVAVLFNLIIMWATLQNLGATLTLAGIAGIILTVGMAVDANVLVFERIREEFAVTKRIASAVGAGYKKAFSAILDSNITTIIAALILLNFDSGPIKGFAVTLIIGIVSSMFTALFMTKFFFAGWVQNPEHKSLTMMNFIKSSRFDFLKKAKTVIIASFVIILAGGAVLVYERASLFGMDFTGGFALNIEVEPKNGVSSYRESVEHALLANGASNQDFQVRELNPTNNLRILLGISMEENGKPFYALPIETDNKDVSYSYENNPRIAWVVSALQKEGFTISERTLSQLDSNWTAMSGQLSDSMRNNAIFGLLLALISILIYITFRFEFKFAISAMLCTLHDVLITVGAIALLHYLHVPVQIDLNTIAAIMTIIGYSLNDTIIIFDRIREDTRLMRKSSFSEIVNHALNVTLSRTTITSGTTLMVLLALVALGGSTIFSFALVMSIGVIFGTLSSLFVASPILLYFHNREQRKESALALKEHS